MHVRLIMLITGIAVLVTSSFAFKGKELGTISFVGNIVYENILRNNTDIYALNGKTGDNIKLTNIGSNTEPQWSPDGSSIAFVSKRKGHQWEIYHMLADGRKQTRVTFTSVGFSSRPRWANNYTIVFSSNNQKGNLSERSVNLLTGEVTTINAVSLDLAVKAQPIEEIKIKYASILKRADKTVGAEQQLEGLMSKIKGQFYYYPTPGQQYAAFYYPFDKKIVLASDKSTELTELAIKGSEPAWNESGQRIAFFYGISPSTKLVIYDLNRRTYDTLVVNKADDRECYSPSWSSDSKKIVFACGPVAGPGETWLYIVDLETKQTRRLVRGSNPDWN